MSEITPAEQIRAARVLVGNSVFEDATLTVRSGLLFVEFESPDLDEIAIPLGALEAEHADKVWLTRDEADIIYAALTLSWEPDYSEATAAARALLDERLGGAR